MGLHNNLNYLFILFLTHVILHCVAFDLDNIFFRRLQHGQVSREKDHYLSNNANEKRDFYNKTKSSRDSLLCKWKSLERELNNNKDGNHLLRNLKADKTILFTTTPLLTGNYIPLISRYLSKSTTQSYIEFDYYNENEIKNVSSVKSLESFFTDSGITKLNHFKTTKLVILDPHTVSFHHFKEPYMRDDIMTPPKAFYSENHHKPLYPYLHPMNNSKIYKKGNPINNLSMSYSISNIPSLGREAATVKAHLRNTRLPTGTSVSASINNIPLLVREDATVKAQLRNNGVLTGTSVSDSINKIPLLGRKDATVKAHFRNSRVPAGTNVSDSINNIPSLGQREATVKAHLRNTRVPAGTNVSDSINNIPLLGRKYATIKAHLRNSRVPTTTSVSDSISIISLLGRKDATVKAHPRNTRVPTGTSLSNSISNIPLLGRKAVTVKAHLRDTQVPNRTNVSDSISSIPLLGLNANTVKAYLINAEVPHRKSEIAPKSMIQVTTPTMTTLPDDKVKFFEMYDTNTLKPPKRVNKSYEIVTQLNGIVSEKMKQNADHNNNLRGRDNINTTKSEKKRNYKIRRSFKEESNSAILNQIQGEKFPKLSHNSIVNNTFMFPRDSVFSKSEIMTKTAVARWSSYPYASVYVYEPTQTHCDAAGISPHWLLAAGSCLSRHALVNSLHARSAFVTYCGLHWRRPERVAYVKRSVVHPKFNPRDKVRRLLYNIGLIQVSDSMEACPRWSPITMMSHQFMTQPGGSVASAVGWGLDRYGTKYMTEKLPHWPLTVYDAQVYQDTCPGSSAYSMAKRQDGDGTSNVYCLLLPPYTKEESDPVHGGLLLVEGKLVALYLQEERRSWGPQSAQYTGVWRLLPWVMEVAREPDDEEAAFDV